MNKTLLIAAVAGILGASVAAYAEPAADHAEEGAAAEKNGCNGKNGCNHAEDGKNGCEGKNSCNGAE